MQPIDEAADHQSELEREIWELDRRVEQARSQAQHAQEDLHVESLLIDASRQHVVDLQFAARRAEMLAQFNPLCREIRIQVGSPTTTTTTTTTESPASNVVVVTLPVDATTTFADLVDTTLVYLGYDERASEFKRCEFLLRDEHGSIFSPEDVVVECLSSSSPAAVAALAGSSPPPPAWFAQLSTRTPMLNAQGVYSAFDPEAELIAYRTLTSKRPAIIGEDGGELVTTHTGNSSNNKPGKWYANPRAFASTWRNTNPSTPAAATTTTATANNKPFIHQANVLRSATKKRRLVLESLFSVAFMLLTVFASYAMVSSNSMPASLVQAYTRRIQPALLGQGDLASIQHMLLQTAVASSAAVRIRQLRVRCEQGEDEEGCGARFSPATESRACFAAADGGRYCFTDVPADHVFTPTIWTVPHGLVEHASFESTGGFFVNWTQSSSSSPFPLDFVDPATRLISIEFNLAEPNVRGVVSVTILLQYLDYVRGQRNDSLCSSSTADTFPFHPALLIQAETAEFSPVASQGLGIAAIIVGLGSIACALRPGNGDLDLIARMEQQEQQGQHLLQVVGQLLRNVKDTPFAHRLQVPSLASKYFGVAWDCATLALLFASVVYSFACVQALPLPLSFSESYTSLHQHFYAKQTGTAMFAYAAYMAVLGCVRCLRLVRPGMLLVESMLESAFPGLLLLGVCCLLPVALAFGATARLIQEDTRLLLTSSAGFALAVVGFYLLGSTAAYVHTFHSYQLVAQRGERGVLWG